MCYILGNLRITILGLNMKIEGMGCKRLLTIFPVENRGWFGSQRKRLQRDVRHFCGLDGVEGLKEGV